MAQKTSEFVFWGIPYYGCSSEHENIQDWMYCIATQVNPPSHLFPSIEDQNHPVQGQLEMINSYCSPSGCATYPIAK